MDVGTWGFVSCSNAGCMSIKRREENVENSGIIGLRIELGNTCIRGKPTPGMELASIITSSLGFLGFGGGGGYGYLQYSTYKEERPIS